MKFLTSKIDDINLRILQDITGTTKCYGLTRQMTLDGEKVNVEIKSNDRVYPDSEHENFFYPKLVDIPFEEIRSPGKTKLYNALINVDLVCLSVNEGFDSHILNALSNYNTLTIKKVNYNSVEIASSELDIKAFDFGKYLFVVSYQIPVKTDNCAEICQ